MYFAISIATFNNEGRSAIYSAICVSELKYNKVRCKDRGWRDRERCEGDRERCEGDRKRYEGDRERCKGDRERYERDRERCKGDCKGLFDSSAWFGEASNVLLLYRLGKLSFVNLSVFFEGRIRFSLSPAGEKVSIIVSAKVSTVSTSGFFFLVLEVTVEIYYK